MRPLLIVNGRIIDPGQGIDFIGSIAVRGRKVAGLAKGNSHPGDQGFDILDASGMIVCPGFIDLHCHLREPGFEEKETIATGAAAAARGGFTTICCMPNTNPPIDTVAMVQHIKKRAAEDAVVRVLPIACVTRGRAGNSIVDMSELAAAGVAGFSDDGSPVASPDLMRRALETCRTPGPPVIDHCEEMALTDGGVVNEGRLAAQLGLKGIPAAAEEKMVARDIALARQTGGRLHLAHLSTAGSVALVREAKQAGLRVTCEVTPHHLTLTEEEIVRHGADAKVSPPLRRLSDLAALVLGLRDDVIDIIATDHAPHTQADKRRGLEDAPFGISGFETALGSLMSLVRGGKLDMAKLISKLTIAPAEILGRSFGLLGTLSAGSEADITIFDPDRAWVVDTNRLLSKGKNTPLVGVTLQGKVMACIAGGKVVFEDDWLKAKHEAWPAITRASPED
jgi:dihydroorotase